MRVRNNSILTQISIYVDEVKYSFDPGEIISFPNKYYNEIEVEVDLFDELEILLDAESVVGAVGITIAILIPSWSLSGDWYYYTLDHNFGTSNYQMDTFEFTGPKFSKIYVYDEPLDTNNIRIYVPKKPDGRFNGKATVIKVGA